MSGAARYGLGLALIVALIAGGVALLHIGVYGWTVFVVLPAAVGAAGAWVFRPTTGARAAGIGVLTVTACTCLLFVVGLEGFICILMSLPLAVPLGALGGWMAYRAMSSRRTAQGLPMLALVPLATVAWDAKAPPAVHPVRTEIEVAAAPEEVWKHVVAFSELPEPEEWFFRVGLAYPKRARIEGSGPGAVRYCEFSTGAFVEPIEVWDEPRLLRFRVTENPAPMEEWSLFARVEPKHLEGYMVSRRGQFRLTERADGHTLLEGTTWYQHGLWPAQYWRWWSDAIIHRIHLRVLDHVRRLAERSR